jgi:hypothetical protein
VTLKDARAGLRRLVVEEIRTVLAEDYARGIPDFALSQVASDAAEGLKRHLKRHIQITASDSVRQREMLAAANEVLEEIEEDIKKVLEDKMLQFIRST